MKVSVLIKALNEEKNIAAAIESALASIEGLDGEVVLADSLSTDLTVQIACRYPIRIVAFSEKSDRGCGAGAQLAYQHSLGEYVYLLDGDMVLHAGFLAEAIAFLDANSEFAGVGGVVNNVFEENLEFRARKARAGALFHFGEVNRLDCGGLYRRRHIDMVGYFSDRNLHSYEELDLGLRLQSVNGKLMRLASPSVDHFTHQIGTYELLWKRVSSGYAKGSGEMVRAAFGNSHFWSTLVNLRMVRVMLFLVFWAVTALLALIVLTFRQNIFFGLSACGFVLISPFIVMSARRRSIKVGTYSVLSWFINAVGFFRGLFSPRIDPLKHIASRIVKPIDRDVDSSPQVDMRASHPN